ncbi:MAG: hypothetical protein M1833_004625 [Piccolia ochrophora]|nr:MAG: hypothetical protein M1833_004625 [Piccolia ochrophora]
MDVNDNNNYSSSSPHRLPTVSASQALQDRNLPRGRRLSTGLPSLDVSLMETGARTGGTVQASPGGVLRGQLTEIYGPPGVGKTSLAMQLSNNALREGSQVAWIDCAALLPGPRFLSMLSRTAASAETSSDAQINTESVDGVLCHFHHYCAPTLAHLLALLLHPNPSFPPKDTSLIVVDGISLLFSLAFPRLSEEHPRLEEASKYPSAKKQESRQWASARRWAVMGDLAAAANKLAALQSIAILMISQTAVKMKADDGAILSPPLSTPVWDRAISSRIVLFRDQASSILAPKNISQGRTEAHVHFASAMEGRNGSPLGDPTIHPVPFIVTPHGLQQVEIPESVTGDNTPADVSSAHVKRKRKQVDDSEQEEELSGVSDGDYGWGGNDATEGHGFLQHSDDA